MNAPLPPDAILAATEDQVSCELRGEAAILSLKDGMYYTLNSVAARVWQLVQTPTDLRTIQQVIVDEYEVEPQRCNTDLQFLLADLVKRGLLTIHQRGPS